ncbi:MAG: DEAD/DEAH box helicase [Thermoproteus sp. AZ2]|uniref:DEAD/DEAH box helicase n=1 Tax=Thermoproteus sp. AZ2 TaxID=1609232 RepID=A0ACC6UYL7_9CREN|nr:MAG: ATP-dependent helicase [Thermoproteus sp. AZ2]
MDFLAALMSDIGREVVYVKSDKAEAPDLCCDVGDVLRPEVAEVFKAKGISRLYRYQYDAIQSIRAGKDTAIIAGTGLGKTEAFLAPLLEEALDSFRLPLALVVYPTKALARDQLARLRSFADRLGVRAMVYDGDTPQRERRLLYESPPHILVTNPDMVSQALMYVAKFRRLIAGVKYVVLDDFHVYGGVLGSHMYWLLRRLSRFAKPQYIATSATLGNPAEFGELLLGRRVNVVEGPRGRRGEVIHVLVRPRTRSKWLEAAHLAKLCIDNDMKCLVFADSHKYAEMIYRALKLGGLSDKAAVHRAGLAAEERARVEEAFRRGDIDVVIATPTLELGIDIGDIDAAVLATVPPTYNRYLQRVGRVGRRGQIGYVVQILGNDPISNYYRNYPHEFFSRAPEPLGLERHNEDVAALHVLAMAMDRPIREGELDSFGASLLASLAGAGLLQRAGPFYRITPAGKEKLEDLSLRGSPHVVKIKSSRGDALGQRELPLALYELHPEAIYMHGGYTYLVKSLDLERRVAVVEPIDAEDLATQALEDMEPHMEEVEEEGVVEGVPYQFGRLRIKVTVYGYALKRFTTDETLGEYTIDPVSYEFKTKGAVFYMPYLKFSPNEAVDWEERAKGYHAAEHVIISASEIAVGAAKTDLGGISYPDGVIVIYDSHIGGNGTTRLLIKNFRRALEIALKIVKGCDCADGCPKCVFSPYCGNNNKMLSRRNAARVLEAVLSGLPAEAREMPKERGIV